MPIRPQPNSWKLILEGGPDFPGKARREGYSGPVPTYRKTVEGVVHEWRQKETDEAKRVCVMEYAE